MSVMYCDNCDKYIDLDYNCEHFTSDGEKCMLQLEDELRNNFDYTEEEVEELLDKAIS